MTHNSYEKPKKLLLNQPFFFLERIPAFKNQNFNSAKNSNSNYNASKLLEFRIDESYVSLNKNTASSNQMNLNNASSSNENLNLNNKHLSQSATNSFNGKVISPINAKIPKVIEKDHRSVKFTSNSSNENAKDSNLIQSSQNMIRTENSNSFISINTGNSSENQNQQSNYNTTGRYLNYFNYFSGKIKENINTITNNLGINQNIEQKDRTNTPEKIQKK